MGVPSNCKYTKDHEWLEPLGEQEFRVGITDYAQRELGDVVFVELPAVGTAVEKGQSLGTVESVKAVSDVYAPVSGTVTAVNDALSAKPESINTDPHGGGWMVTIATSKGDELNALLSQNQYESLLSELAK